MPIEFMSFKYIREAEPFQVPSNDGGLTLTDKRMIIYKWWFESQANKYPSVTTHSLSPHGVAIPGIPVTDISSLLNLPGKRKYIDEQITRIKSFTEPDADTETTYQRLKKAILDLTENLHILGRIAEKGIKTTREAISSLANGKIPVSLIEELNAIDKKITSESSRIIAGFLIQPVIQGLLHTATREKTPEEVLEYTEKLYTELKDSCDFHYDALVRAGGLL
jgi:hypothetical protein